MGTGEITLVISAIVALFGILTFAFARSGDHGKREYLEGQTTNKRILRDNLTREVILERLDQIPELWRGEVELELKHARFCDAHCERKYHAVIHGNSQGDGLRRSYDR